MISFFLRNHGCGPHLNERCHRLKRGAHLPNGQLLGRERSKNGNSLLYGLRRESAKTDPKTAPFGAPERKVTSRKKTNSFTGGSGEQFLRREWRRQFDPQVHAAFGPREAGTCRKVACAAFESDAQALGTGQLGLLEMPGKFTRLRKTQEHRLGELIGVQIARLFGFGQAGNNRLGGKYPTNAQTGKSDL